MRREWRTCVATTVWSTVGVLAAIGLADILSARGGSVVLMILAGGFSALLVWAHVQRRAARVHRVFVLGTAGRPKVLRSRVVDVLHGDLHGLDGTVLPQAATMFDDEVP